MYASCLASDYDEIFCNYNLRIKWKKVNIFRDYGFLRNLKFEEKKRLIILDEGWINFNSREFMRDENRAIWKLLFVSRKFNFDFIFISQYDFTLDKYIRYSADYMFFLKKKIKNKKYYIEVNKYRIDNKTWKDFFIDSYDFNGLEYMKLKGISYDTRDLATLQKA